jgi:MoxR-like ATPase
MYPEPYQRFIEATQSTTVLAADSRFAAAGHRWSDAERDAVVFAWASCRPLLLRGEAGCGKSQVARAVAACLGVPLWPEVIHPRFEAGDLKFRVDAVKRLAHAQLLATLKPAHQDQDRETVLKQLSEDLHEKHFVDRGVLWNAMRTAPRVDLPFRDPDRLWPRAVVLIDEIDKADADVPNALLDALGNRSFDAPGEVVSCAHNLPLVLLSTNEDRELPPAFLRRCVVVSLQPDDSSMGTFTHWLQQRALAHPPIAELHALAPECLALAAQQLWEDRQTAKRNDWGKVGLAEYLDLLYAIARLAQGDGERALALVQRLGGYALRKHGHLRD